LLRTKIDDPRLLGVTITDVQVTPDTKRADVYYSLLGDEEAKQAAQQGLDGAAGWLRRELGSRLSLRNTPELIFHLDPSLEHGERIDQLLGQLDIPPVEDEE
jgi:ribosome-binding factor A